LEGTYSIKRAFDIKSNNLLLCHSPPWESEAQIKNLKWHKGLSVSSFENRSPKDLLNEIFCDFLSQECRVGIKNFKVHKGSSRSSFGRSRKDDSLCDPSLPRVRGWGRFKNFKRHKGSNKKFRKEFLKMSWMILRDSGPKLSALFIKSVRMFLLSALSVIQDQRCGRDKHSFRVLDYHKSPYFSHLGCLIIVSPLAFHVWCTWLSWIFLPLMFGVFD